MQINKTENAIRNIRAGVINRLITTLFPVAVRTVFIYFLGAEYLGLNGLTSSVINVLNLTELGIGSAIIVSMYKPLAEDDLSKMCALIKCYKRVYQTIGCVVLCIGITILPILKYLIKGTYPDDINIYVLFGISLIGTVSSYFLFAYQNSLLYVHQRNDVVSNLNSVCSCIRCILQILTIILTKNFYLYYLIEPVISILFNIWTAYYSKKMFPQYKPKGNLLSDDVRALKNKVIALFFQKMGHVVNNSVDNIVISAFLGLVALGKYANYYFIIYSLDLFISIGTSSIVAGIGNSMVTNSIEKNYNDFKKFQFILAWIIGWCSICYICLCQSFINWWIGETFLLPIGIAALCAVYLWSNKIQSLILTYKEAAGIWERDKYRPLFAALVNLFVNIILVQKIGLYGIVISTICSELFINLPWSAKTICEWYFHVPLKKVLLAIMYYAVVTIGAGIITFYVCCFITEQSFRAIIFKSIICMICPNLLFWGVYHKSRLFKDSLCEIKKIIKTF